MGSPYKTTQPLGKINQSRSYCSTDGPLHHLNDLSSMGKAIRNNPDHVLLIDYVWLHQ